jgi:diketogulonate reductase-like aldo/keto reductase
MELREFGSTRRRIPIIGQGTWYLDAGDRGAAIAALRHGIDLGMTHIDTAEMYGDGQAEELVGAAIDGRRDEVFLVSKVLPQNATLAGTIAACHRSLARLRTDHLDCYLLHWRGPHPLEATIEAFSRLIEAGHIHAWGVSNFDVPDLNAAYRIAGDGAIACNQVLYHLQRRAIEFTVLPWCEKHGVAVTGYSPFGHGKFPAPDTHGGRVLEEIARAHRATPRQIALSFLTRKPPLFTIPKASTPAHAEENAVAGDLILSRADLVRLDAVFPRPTHVTALPVL